MKIKGVVLSSGLCSKAGTGFAFAIFGPVYLLYLNVVAFVKWCVQILCKFVDSKDKTHVYELAYCGEGFYLGNKSTISQSPWTIETTKSTDSESSLPLIFGLC